MPSFTPHPDLFPTLKGSSVVLTGKRNFPVRYKREQSNTDCLKVELEEWEHQQ